MKPEQINPHQYDMGELLRKIEVSLSENNIEKINFTSPPLIKGQCSYVCDFKKGIVTHQNGVRELFGFDENEFDLEFVTTNFHPDDQPTVQHILKSLFAFVCFNKSTPECAFYITYRARKKNGDYIRILRQSKILEMDTEGRMVSNYSLVTDISFMDQGNKVHWDLDPNFPRREEFMESIKKNIRMVFTPKEMEILILLQKGLNSKEIGQQLNASHHTVDTHRRKMLAKTGSKNVAGMLDFALQTGIL